MFLQEKMHAHPSTLPSWLLCYGIASSHITSWQVEGKKMEAVADFIFLGSKVTADCDCSHEVKWRLLLGRKAMANLDSVLKSRDITLPTKVHIAKAVVFPVVMCRCESWTINGAECWRIDAFKLWSWKRLFESPLDSKEIKPVSPKGDQPWIYILKTDAEARILWTPDAKSQLIGKEPDAGKDWGRNRRGWQNEIVGWHHQLSGLEFEQTPGYSEWQGSLACCRPWGHKEPDTTNWTTATTESIQFWN